MPTGTRSRAHRKRKPKNQPRSSSAKSKNRRSGGRARKPTQAKAPARKQPRREPRIRPAIGNALAGHVADLVGIGFFALAVVAAMGIWAGSAGPVGEAIDASASVVFGKAASVVPLLLVGVGLILVLGSSIEHSTRLLIGSVLAAVSVLGLIHLGSGNPGFETSWEVIADAGGYVGALVAVALSGALSAPGAAVVCLAGVVAGVLIATGAKLRTLAEGLRKYLTELDTGIMAEAEPSESTGSTAELYDVETDTAPVPTAPAESEAPTPAPTSKKTADAPDKTARKPEQMHLKSPKLPDAERYKLPEANKILARSSKTSVDTDSVADRGKVIEATLREFNVGATLTRLIVGPTVTRYEIELEQGVKVNRLTNLAADIQYALATPDVRIIAPIPGRSAIGLEVPNVKRRDVTVGDILGSEVARKEKHPLAVMLGRDIAGQSVVVNLGKMPHVLISGQTGSGKSSCINSVLVSLLCRTRPSEVRMILIDPKRVELGRFDGVPHLLGPVVTDPKRAANAFGWAVEEMDQRYERLANAGARDITSFNSAADRGEIKNADGEPVDRLPYIVVVVDELADLMTVRRREVEDSIQRLAQMARAVGIHLVLATQRPSVDVITGVIRSNIPTRMAFKTRTLIESRVILDQQGAEKLIGQGDLLYLAGSSGTTERVQACFVTEREVANVVEHWRDEVRRVGTPDTIGEHAPSEAQPPAVVGAPAHDSVSMASPAALTQPSEPENLFDREPPSKQDADTDEFLGRAMELVVESQLGSTSMLQRKLRVGFARAGRIMDLLEERSVVGPSVGSKARKVLVAPEQLDEAKASLGL